MKVVYHPAARKALNRMPARDRDAIEAKLLRFAETGHGDVKKLAGSDEYRMRIGVWRAIFVLVDDMLVLRVAHRREAYR